MSAEFVLTVEQVGRRDVSLLVPDRLAFGRDCDGFLLADAQASRRHAEFVRVDDQLSVIDLGSSNGTTCNGEPVVDARRVGVGDVVELGTTRIVVSTLETSPDAARRGTVVRTTDSTDRPKSAIMLLTDAVADESGADPDETGVLAELAATLGTESTFTIVFSDIEGSTSYATRVGDSQWMQILDRHNSLIRRQLVRFGGREVKSQGDGFMMCFSSARRAVDFAVEVQRQLDLERRADPSWNVRIRIGLHAGEAFATSDGDLFGRHVIIASRVADQADGGEILVSELVRELISGGSTQPFGESRTVVLKGIGEQVVHPIVWVGDDTST